MTNFPQLNKAIAGTGYQFHPTRTRKCRKVCRWRVENECGDLLFYTRNIFITLKKLIPYGCGGHSVDNLFLIAAKEIMEG